MPLVRNDPDLRKQMSGLLNSLLPGGLLPEQVLLNPDLPLVFADPENKDLENFKWDCTVSIIRFNRRTW